MPKPNPPQRFGLFGGSFDPVHNGHLLLAECCRDQARLDQVWFTPAAVQPHKPDGPVASNKHRSEMLRLAIEGHEGFGSSQIEIERGGVSYTVDTLRELTEAYPEDEFFLSMGADTLHDLPKWKEPSEILKMAMPVVVHRAGEAPADFRVLDPFTNAARADAIADLAVEMPPRDISSSEIRARIAKGKSIDDCVPERVAEYITRHRLYLAQKPMSGDKG